MCANPAHTDGATDGTLMTALNSFLNSFISIGRVISAAADVETAMNNIRDGISNDKWQEMLNAEPLLEDLWNACADLESALKH